MKVFDNEGKKYQYLEWAIKIKDEKYIDDLVKALARQEIVVYLGKENGKVNEVYALLDTDELYDTIWNE